MNNIYYIVQKVKAPELRPLFGNDWIKQCNGQREIPTECNGLLENDLELYPIITEWLGPNVQ